jgi:hypothetical protein
MQGRAREAGSIARLPARELEQVVMDAVFDMLAKDERTRRAASQVSALGQREREQALRRVVRRVEVSASRIAVTLLPSALEEADRGARPDDDGDRLRSDLNQREYCEAQGIPLKAFGNWRAKFKAEPPQPEHKLLYRRRGLSHRLSHTVSHSLSHMTNEPLSRPIVPPAREGHRRKFSENDKRRIVEEAAQPGYRFVAAAVRRRRRFLRLQVVWQRWLWRCARPRRGRARRLVVYWRLY